MITTGSKFAYALALVLAVAAVVYGYTTGGGEVGPLSVGYKGAVGDHLGYGILLFGASLSLLVGSCLTAFRDADPEAVAGLTGSEVPPAPVPGNSYWPVLGAFGAGLTVVGLVLNNVFFVAGLLVLGVVAAEWTIQAWADRATGDPAVNREIRNRLMLPVEVPVAGALAIAVVVVGFSRVFLTFSQEAAVWIAIGVAASVFGIGTLLSAQTRVRRDVVAGLLSVAAVATIGLGIFGALRGERDFHHHDEDEQGEVSPDAGAGATDNGSTDGVEESN